MGRKNIWPPSRLLITAIAACLLIGLAAAPDAALAQASGFWGMRSGGGRSPGESGGNQSLPSNSLPSVLDGVGIDQKVGTAVPPDLEFKDETGQPVHLRDYFGKKPVILALVYYECPMLCSQVLNGLTESLKGMNLKVGDDFNVLTVSFDPKEGSDLAAAKRQNYLERYGQAGAGEGWHFLTGAQESIARLTDAVGFRYKFDPEAGQYVHAAVITLLTADGTIARYFFGVEYAPRDVRLSLVEASKGKIGTPVDQVLLFCYHYDPAQGKYGVAITNILRLGGAVTLLGLGTLVLGMLRREKKSPAPVGGAAG